MNKLTAKYPSLPFVAPFAAFILALGLRSVLPLNPTWEYGSRVVLVSIIVLLVSRQAISWRPTRPWSSVFVGILVFGIWIFPDLISSSYRHFWLFENSVAGKAESTLPVALRSDIAFLILRLYGTAVVVPIIEELFWRGWLLRFLIDADFRKVPMGTFSPMSFFFTAILFASEHGPFWDVGLVAGLIYNWWMVRTRNVADCMIAHSITNSCLAAFVLFRDHWQYWL